MRTNPTKRDIQRTFLVLAGISGALAVATGALGAHALEKTLSDDMLDVYHTGARYHMYHTLALFGVALLWKYVQNVWVKSAGWLFAAGIVIFSGTLYLLAITGITKLGMITPLGGVSFIAGWLCLALGAAKRS